MVGWTFNEKCLETVLRACPRSLIKFTPYKNVNQTCEANFRITYNHGALRGSRIKWCAFAFSRCTPGTTSLTAGETSQEHQAASFQRGERRSLFLAERQAAEIPT